MKFKDKIKEEMKQFKQAGMTLILRKGKWEGEKWKIKEKKWKKGNEEKLNKCK